MKPTTKRLFFYGAILLLPASWIGSEFLYAARIRPGSIRTVAAHFQRFGEPRFVYEVQHDGSTFYEFTGFTRTQLPLLAVPSSPPAYIYDADGKLVDWCSDPGDQPKHRQTWPRVSTTPLDIQAVRQRFSQ
ncbi:MAG: hypothetical protein ACR2H1_05475 [Limisphaerales bacterium]